MRLKSYHLPILLGVVVGIWLAQVNAMRHRGVEHRPGDLCASIAEERYSVLRDLVDPETMAIGNREVIGKKTGFRGSFDFMKSLRRFDPVVMMSRGQCLTVSLGSTFFVVRRTGKIQHIMTVEQFLKMGETTLQECADASGPKVPTPADGDGAQPETGSPRDGATE